MHANSCLPVRRVLIKHLYTHASTLLLNGRQYVERKACYISTYTKSLGKLEVSRSACARTHAVWTHRINDVGEVGNFEQERIDGIVQMAAILIVLENHTCADCVWVNVRDANLVSVYVYA